MKLRNALQNLTNFFTTGGNDMATNATQASVRVPNYTDAMVDRMVGAVSYTHLTLPTTPYV